MLLGTAVIGSTVEAAYYALVNDFYFISTRKTPPMFYKKLEHRIFDLENETEAWSKLNVMLALASKRVAFEDGFNVRVSENIIKFLTGNVSFKYKFEELHIFDTTGIQLENEQIETKPKTYVIFDDFELSVLGPKRYHLPSVSSKSGFIKELHFYSSNRVDGSDFITDCVVESELTHDQLNSFDYSDTMVRFYLERYLKSIGVHGRFMRLYKNGKAKYRKPKVVHVKREVYEKDNCTYRDTESIKFLNLSLGEIIEQSPKR